jgi:glycosyltransferase involved in cell wall biosynthesis
MTKIRQRLTIVQYAGDFREAAERLADGGPETYRGQKYTVDYVEGLAQTLSSVTTITGYTDRAYEVTLPSGAQAVGAGFTNRFDGRRLARLVGHSRPDLLIIRSPIRPVLWWAVRRRVRTLVMLADSFNPHSIRARMSGSILGLVARAPNIEWVGNHGLRAAEQLIGMGAPARKVLAWDYPAFDRPEDRLPKTHSGSPARIVYVGLMTPAKGVDDLILAVKRLVDRARAVHLDLVGRVDDGRLAGLIAQSGLSKNVTLCGPLENARVLTFMREADIVVVPSRHDYSEGMPLTIYEALCSRTPLILSDHPMFAGSIIDGENGLVFQGGDSEQLANQIAKLLDDKALYHRLSCGSTAAWGRLQNPLKWADLISDWIEDSPETRARLSGHALGR